VSADDRPHRATTPHFLPIHPPTRLREVVSSVSVVSVVVVVVEFEKKFEVSIHSCHRTGKCPVLPVHTLLCRTKSSFRSTRAELPGIHSDDGRGHKVGLC